MHTRYHVAALALIALAVITIGACSDDSAEPATTSTAPPSDTITWEPIAAGDDCECADGSPYAFSVRAADPKKLLVYLQGGGACFTEETCNFDDPRYTVTAHVPGLGGPDDPSAEINPAKGIFDVGNDRNPFSDYSIVYIPYCTGDLFLGDQTTTYSPELAVHHLGSVNATAAIDDARSRFPEAREIVVIGQSAGAAPTPLYAGLLADRFPTAKIAAIADGSGAYPDIPAVNVTIGDRWGALQSVPPNWKSTEGMTAERWSLPGLFVYAAEEHPDIQFSRFDFAYDHTQEFYGSLAGIDSANLLQLIDANERHIEAGGVTLSSYIAPGSDHTILASDQLYSLSVNGVALIDWLRNAASFDVPGDVHCLDCGASRTAGVDGDVAPERTSAD